MPNRSPHDLQEGHILTDDVYNLDGNLLFPSGTKLTDKQIEIMMMWGVEIVSVEGIDGKEKAISIQNFSNTVKQDAELAVNERFKLVKSSHPAVKAIRELAVLELAKAKDSPLN